MSEAEISSVDSTSDDSQWSKRITSYFSGRAAELAAAGLHELAAVAREAAEAGEWPSDAEALNVGLRQHYGMVPDSDWQVLRCTWGDAGFVFEGVNHCALPDADNRMFRWRFEGSFRSRDWAEIMDYRYDWNRCQFVGPVCELETTTTQERN